jgi:uncharacterized protein
VLGDLGAVAVAVSGGVDSMTLAAVVARELGAAARMLHAVSPAVPPRATERVVRHAERGGWSLELVDAGEFADTRYLANPVNRCYFCKSHLYDAMAARADEPLVSGTNLDDLGDFRPGLEAARERGVRHPYVEAGIDKAGVRAIARSLGLRDLAELPAAPCLSSRVETGLAIEPLALAAIDEVEEAIAREHRPRTVRCRLRGAAIVVELDAETLAALGDVDRARLRERVAHRFRAAGLERPVGFTTYSQGSAFLRGDS